MSFPQELVDAVIDCIGVPYAQTNAKIGYSNLPVSQSGRDDLQSLALVSRACNHRVRSHLFAHHRVHNSPCSLDQCPDVLLGYARTLTIFKCGDPADIIPSIRRFASSPLVSISLRHLNLPQELPEMLKLSFPNIRRIFVRDSMLNPFVLLNLVSTLERVDQLCLMLCTLDLDIEIDNYKSPPGLPPLHGCLIVDDPYYSVTVLLSRIPLPLRSLRYASRAHTPEQGFINACAGSLENLQVIMLIDWARQDFTLDLGRCANLRHISFVAFWYHGELSFVRSISELLLTLRDHQLLSIQLTVDLQPPSIRSGGRRRLHPKRGAWEGLDQILRKLGVQAQGRGETLVFTSNRDSSVAETEESLVELLPQFNQIGVCKTDMA